MAREVYWVMQSSLGYSVSLDVAMKPSLFVLLREWPSRFANRVHIASPLLRLPTCLCL